MKKVLDSDGRIFGIINVFDFLCLLFLVLLLPMIYHGYKLIQIKQEVTDVGGNSLPSTDIPVVKALLNKDIPVALEMRNLTREEVSFIEKRMDRIAWKEDIRFLRLLKKTTASVMLGAIPLTQVHGLEFLISVRVSILRVDFSEPDVLFRNAKILGQVVEVNVGNRNFKGVLRSLRLNEENL
ncbi:MAG: hypothetical protein AAB309_04180 [Deltaproteobacteria bacterium]